LIGGQNDIDVENIMATPGTTTRKATDPSIRATEDQTPLRASHTPNFPELLRRLGASLFVTTYQAGKLVMVRDEGDQLNAHFRFSGIPITERLAPEKRICGVCVVDLKLGETVALLKFESGVQEIFAVALLRRRFPDLINEDERLLESSFVIPTEYLDEVAATVRTSVSA
jgi:hypothetical protein